MIPRLLAEPGPRAVIEFYGHRSGSWACFSNFYDQRPFDFVLPPELCALPLAEAERTVSCTFSEKAIMLCKAAAFGDNRSFQQMCASRDPADCKRLGRNVRGFDDKVWRRIVCSVAFEVVWQKFSKSPELQQCLLGTGEKLIVEATRNDTNWGIGLDIGDPRTRDPSQWLGTNMLGWALMETRGALRRQEAEESEARCRQAKEERAANWAMDAAAFPVMQPATKTAVQLEEELESQPVAEVEVQPVVHPAAEITAPPAVEPEVPPMAEAEVPPMAEPAAEQVATKKKQKQRKWRTFEG